MAATARSARAQRVRKPQASLQESDSGADTEQETPKATKAHGLRRRLSEVQDKSYSADAPTGRPPLRAVNINDDAAEKRRRRKSAKPLASENAEAGPSSEGIDMGQSGVGESSRTAQARQKQLASVVETPMINVPLDVMSSNFEEWMKMAMDNASLDALCSSCSLPLRHRKLMLPTPGTLH